MLAVREGFSLELFSLSARLIKRMADPQKLVLMVQVTRLQGGIWQSVLKSQQIGVIWEAPDANLVENLDQLKAAGLTLPDLLLVDMRIPNFNPYAFCRWCREQYPGVKVILTNSAQTEVTLSERQWAVNQGASDLFPRFHRENIVSGVTAAAKRLLEILDDHPLNNGALIAVLLGMKRELEARTAPAKSQVYLSKPEQAPLALSHSKSLSTSIIDRYSDDRYSDRAIAPTRNGNTGKKPTEVQTRLASDYTPSDYAPPDYDTNGSPKVSTVEKVPPQTATLEGIYGMSSIQSATKRWSDPKPTPDSQFTSDRPPMADPNPPTDSNSVNESVPISEPFVSSPAPRKRPLYYRGVSHS